MPFIFDIKRFALHDGPGIRSTVFFKGCPLRCAWCHNPESQQCMRQEAKEVRRVDGKHFEGVKVYGEEKEISELVELLKKDTLFYQESGGGITVSGGEPFMQFDALMELLDALRAEELHIAIDTSGYVKQERLLEAAAMTDLFLYDLKAMDPELHEQYTAKDNRLILDNADALLNQGSRVIFRIPFIPGVNDSKEEQQRFQQFLSERKASIHEVHLLPYHKTGRNKYERMEMEYRLPSLQEPDAETVEQVRLMLAKSGVSVLVGG